MLVIFLFLRSAAATVIPALAVPISLIATCAAMYGLGFSITDVLKHSYATTVTSIQDYTTKVFEFTDTNIKAAAEHATKLMSVRTPAEFFTLSNNYAKRQFENLTRQAQELGAIVQKMTIVKDTPSLWLFYIRPFFNGARRKLERAVGYKYKRL